MTEAFLANNIRLAENKKRRHSLSGCDLQVDQRSLVKQPFNECRRFEKIAALYCFACHYNVDG